MYPSAAKANVFYCAKGLFEIGMGWISAGCLCLQPTHDLSRLKTLVGPGTITITHKVYKHSNIKNCEASLTR